MKTFLFCFSLITGAALSFILISRTFRRQRTRYSMTGDHISMHSGRLSVACLSDLSDQSDESVNSLPLEDKPCRNFV